MIVRKATVEDAALLSEVRKLQLIDEGIAPNCDIDAELDTFFKKWLVSKDFLQLIAEENGKLLSTAAIVYYDLPPSFTNKIGVRGYVLMYIQHRNTAEKVFQKCFLKKFLWTQSPGELKKSGSALQNLEDRFTKNLASYSRRAIWSLHLKINRRYKDVCRYREYQNQGR